MNFSAVVLMLLASQVVPDSNWLGQFVVANDRVNLQRDGITYQAQLRSYVLANDQIQTSPYGDACFFIQPGVFVYLGPSTSLNVQVDEKGPVFHLQQGELRIVNSGELDTLLISPEGQAAFKQGTLRAAVKQGSTRFYCESGVVTMWTQESIDAANSQSGEVPVSYNGPEETQLESGQEVTIPSADNPNPTPPSPGEPWQIDPNQMQLRGAEDAGRMDEEQRNSELGEPIVSDPTTGDATQTNDIASNLSLGLGGLFSGSPGFNGAGGFAGSSFSGSASGGYNGDAGRYAANGPINAVTAQSRYSLSGVTLTPGEQFGQRNFSIGTGVLPTTYVDAVIRANGDPLFGSGNKALNTPGRIIEIPKTNAYLLELNVYDSSIDPANQTVPDFLTFPGFTPSISGADPLLDELAKINQSSTFAFGEFRITGSENPELTIRRSDDDRDFTGDLNPDLEYETATVGSNGVPDYDGNYSNGDSIQLPTQNSLDQLPARRVSELNMVRKAALTTLIADQFHDFAKRTGQTRFVLDGKIIDISGYKKP